MKFPYLFFYSFSKPDNRLNNFTVIIEGIGISSINRYNINFYLISKYNISLQNSIDKDIKK